MTVNLVVAGSADGYIISQHTSSYTTAVNGNDFVVDTTSTSNLVGQENIGDFFIYQSFYSFDYTAVAGELIPSAHFNFYNTNTQGTGASRILELRSFDWGATITSADWRTPSQLGALTLVSSVGSAHQIPSSRNIKLGLIETSVLESSTTLRYVMNSSKNRLSQSPGTNITETNRAASVENATTSARPVLAYYSVPENLLYRNLGAQVKLSDDTHVLLEFDPNSLDSSTTSTVRVKHHDGTTLTSIYTLNYLPSPAGISKVRGYQASTLVVDASDNIYWFTPNGYNTTSYSVRAFTKGVGHTWTFTGVTNTVSMPLATNYGYVNNAVGAWHNVGTNGTIAFVVGFSADDAVNGTGQNMSYALMNCEFLLTGAGTITRKTAVVGSSGASNTVGASDNNGFTNDTGSLLDICKAPGSNTVGYLVSTTADSTNEGVNGSTSGIKQMSISRYELNSSGTDFVAERVDRGGLFPERDGAGKIRVIGIGSTQLLTACVDPGDSYGLSITHNTQTSSGLSNLAAVWMGLEDIASLPLGSELSNSSAWDMVYNSDENQAWLYYIDRNDDQRLMRTAVDLSTGNALQNEVEVSSGIGAAGSINHALRVNRGELKGERVLINVANETSAGVHSIVYITDSLNPPPTQPTLTPKANFDADDSAVFSWTFNDTASDSQSAFQLVIDQVGGSEVHNTTKTTCADTNYTLPGSTLVNGQDFTWNVTVWDSFDQVSPVSNDGTFTTSNTGSVTITDPASDNPADVITDNYLIAWAVTGATQEDYRVVVRRTDTEALLVDTGWVVSAATTYEVTGMLTDIEYRVEVTVREAMVESNTAERLITPSYGTPEIPVVTLNTYDDLGYVQVTVVNPTPQGDRPNPVRNDIYRRLTGTADPFILVGTTDPNSTFDDYEAASHAAYDYFARAETD